MPFIQSVYWASVVTSSSGSACAEQVAFGVQYGLQAPQPFPVSQASKKASATLVIDAVFGVMMASSLEPARDQRFRCETEDITHPAAALPFLFLPSEMTYYPEQECHDL